MSVRQVGRILIGVLTPHVFMFPSRAHIIMVIIESYAGQCLRQCLYCLHPKCFQKQDVR